MRLSLQPFPRCAWVKVPVTPLGYVLAVGKLWDQVPRFVPEEDFPVTVFVDLPEGDQQEGLQMLRAKSPGDPAPGGRVVDLAAAARRGAAVVRPGFLKEGVGMKKLGISLALAGCLSPLASQAEDYPYQILEQLHYQHLYRRQIQPQPQSQPVIQRFVSGNTVIACVTYWTGWQWATQCFTEGQNR